MRLPSMRRPALVTGWLRRPALLAVLVLVLGAALLSGGLVVARAVTGTPAADASPAPTASAGGTTPDNVAAAVNTKDGRTVYAIKLKIVRTSADTVTPTNAAIAVNSGCTGCATVAIAFEAVLVTGSPSTFAPTNLAIAYNEACSGCVAFAEAYQQVVQTSTRVRITPEGRRRIAAIRKDLNSIRKDELSIEEIRARVAAAEQAFAEVLRTEIVPVGKVTDPAPADAPDISDDPAAPAEEPAGSPEPTSSGSGTGPSSSPTGGPSPNGTATSTPTPSATASSSPTTTP